MVSPELDGPFPLEEDVIKTNVTGAEPGNYTLGYLDDNGSFVVCYVGRSDENIREKLLKWVGAIARYTHFQYAYAEDKKEAFITECHNYHDYGGSEILYNSNHPYRPDDTDWLCPRCSFYGRY